jgi:glycosyltransferase involved in cell wall biosynthesis
MKLGYAYSRYPVLSQTFCDAEMMELERRGFELVLASMYPPKTPIRHEYLARLHAKVQYAPEKSQLEKLTRKAKRKGQWPEHLIAAHEQKYGADYKAALRARNALFFAALFEGEGVRHFHVHFANRAAHTALFIKAVTGMTFSITAHGQDFMADLGSAELLSEICDAAEFVAAETDYSRDLLAKQCPRSADKMQRVYNGIDLAKFQAPVQARAAGPTRLLSVGRLVAFKGFDVLIDACAELHHRGAEFICEIIGEGDLREELEARVAHHRLGERIKFSGAQSQANVTAALRDCDVFVLASVTDERGASDVFPTVIAEAMASGRAVVSTTTAGIPELVGNDETGFLAPPKDARALAEAIITLIGNAELRERFGRAGRARIEQRFTIEKTIEPLVEQFMMIEQRTQQR